jgi:hypothetical protein
MGLREQVVQEDTDLLFCWRLVVTEGALAPVAALGPVGSQDWLASAIGLDLLVRNTFEGPGRKGRKRDRMTSTFQVRRTMCLLAQIGK